MYRIGARRSGRVVCEELRRPLQGIGAFGILVLVGAKLKIVMQDRDGGRRRAVLPQVSPGHPVTATAHHLALSSRPKSSQKSGEIAGILVNWTSIPSRNQEKKPQNGTSSNRPVSYFETEGNHLAAVS